MSKFEVLISFVEVVEGQERSFTHSITVSAQNSSQAREIAIAEFDELARCSSVGWIRTVLDVDVRRIKIRRRMKVGQA